MTLALKKEKERKLQMQQVKLKEVDEKIQELEGQITKRHSLPATSAGENQQKKLNPSMTVPVEGMHSMG